MQQSQCFIKQGNPEGRSTTEVITMRVEKIGMLMTGIIFLLLSLAIFYFLFVEELWDSPEIDFLALVSAFFMLGLSLWVIWDTVARRPDSGSATSPSPVVDEWIGEKGREAVEVEQWGLRLEDGEDLLALIAAWGDQPINRFAVTTRRIVLYYHTQIQDGVTLPYDQIAAVRQAPHRVLRHVADITLTRTNGRVITFENAGKEYAETVVALITARQQRPSGTGGSHRAAAYCTHCGASIAADAKFCGACGARR
jgi:hypothetical protein